MEEAHLGVRHLGDRLAVDPDELEEGDQGEPGGQHRGDVTEELEVLLGDVLERVEVEARGRVDALDQRGLEAGVASRLVERVATARLGEQVLDVAEGEPPALPGLADLGQ
jgi:hypothetical protein